jgi:uncharacterized protein YjbJ (UPF0337 family)
VNKDQVKGRAKEVAGKLKKSAGQVIGNPRLESEGAMLEVEGKAQKTVGDIKRKISKSINNA